jgi:uncharacterized membrane protein
MSSITNEKKISATIQSMIVFIIVSLPVTYNFTNGIFDSLLGIQLTESSGCPNMIGLLIHALVFGVIVYILMSINQ